MMRNVALLLLTAFLLAQSLVSAADGPGDLEPSSAASSSVAASKAEPGIELAFLNGLYSDIDSDLQPIEQAGMVIRIQSPDHEVTVHGNRLSLERSTDGLVEAKIEVDLEGGGTLIADLESFGISQRFTDQVEIPRQALRVAGTVRIRETPEGFVITIVEAPPSASLEIKSEMASQIVGVCEGLDKIPLFSLQCDRLRAALSKATGPLPEAGEELLLVRQRLTAAERAYFAGVADSGDEP